MPIPSSLLYAGGGALTGAALGGLTSKPEDRVQNALRGGAIGGLVGGGAAALARRSPTTLAGEVAHAATAPVDSLAEARKMLGARLPPPTPRGAVNLPHNPMSPTPNASFRAYAEGPDAGFMPDTLRANAVVDQALKVAMSPLQGALAGAVTGGVISGGASAVAGERDPKKLLRNAGAGAAIGGCAGYGIAHSAGACEHAKGVAEGYARRKAVEPSLDVNELIRQAMGPLDALRGRP